MNLLTKILFFLKPTKDIHSLKNKFAFYLDTHNIHYTTQELGLFCGEMSLHYFEATPESVRTMCIKYFGEKADDLEPDDYNRITTIFLSFDKTI